MSGLLAKLGRSFPEFFPLVNTIEKACGFESEELSAEDLYCRGTVLMMLTGREFEAEEDFRKSLAKYEIPGPVNSDVMRKKATMFVALKQYPDAFDCFDQLTKREITNAKMFYNKGLVLVEMKRYGDAITCFEQCLKLHPNHAGTLFQLGRTMHESQKYNESLEYFIKALTFIEDEIGIIHQVRSMHQKYVQAIEEYRKSTPEGEDSPEVGIETEFRHRVDKLNELLGQIEAQEGSSFPGASPNFFQSPAPLKSPRTIVSTSAAESSVALAKRSIPPLASSAETQEQKTVEPVKTGLKKDKNYDFIRSKIPMGFEVTASWDRGDCFFDSVAQGVANANKTIPGDVKQGGCKQLRLLCHQYLRDLAVTPDKNWVKQHMDKNATTGLDTDKFSYCFEFIQFTAPEMDKFIDSKTGLSRLATWGRPQIEGKIICEVLKIKIHMIEFVEFDRTIKEINQLIDASGLKDVAKDEISWQDPNVVHVMNYRGHFTPLVRSVVPDMSKGAEPSLACR